MRKAIISLYIINLLTFINVLFFLVSCDDYKQKSILINYWKLNNTDIVIEDTFQVSKKSFKDIQSFDEYKKYYPNIENQIKINFDEYKKYYPNIENQIKINFDNLLSNKPVHFKDYSLNKCGFYNSYDKDTIVLIKLQNKNIDAEDYYTYSKKYGIVIRLYFHDVGYTIFKKVLIKGKHKKEILFDSILNDLRENSDFWYFSK